MPLERKIWFTVILCAHSGIICAMVCRCSARLEQLKKSAFFVRPGCGSVVRPMWSRASWHKSCELCTKVQKTDQKLPDGWSENHGLHKFQDCALCIWKCCALKMGLWKITFLQSLSYCFQSVSSSLLFCASAPVSVSFSSRTYLLMFPLSVHLLIYFLIARFEIYYPHISI